MKKNVSTLYRANYASESASESRFAPRLTRWPGAPGPSHAEMRTLRLGDSTPPPKALPDWKCPRHRNIRYTVHFRVLFNDNHLTGLLAAWKRRG